MLPQDEKKKFVEVRVFVADRSEKPADLSLVNASLLLVPKEGKPWRRDFQLMMPDPPASVPASKPHALPDGRQIRTAVIEFSEPFQRDPSPGGGAASVYFKVDVPAEAARKGTPATLQFQFPEGTQKLEIRSLFGE